MLQINLSEFYHYELPQLLEFIQVHNETEYNITLPKKTVAGRDCNFNVFWEYYHAAFVGQELWQISTYFTYTVPCIKKAQSFSFQVTVYDQISLAVTLYFLVNGLYVKNDPALGDKYDAAAALLLEESFNGKKSTACWGLIWLANLFLCKIE
ncbi:MAG: hypothetical protein JWP81_3262 [Ferruginibacter sp.]|nr:hypothetical protein [Ferruginibacter sp.]